MHVAGRASSSGDAVEVILTKDNFCVTDIFNLNQTGLSIDAVLVFRQILRLTMFLLLSSLVRKMAMEK